MKRLAHNREISVRTFALGGGVVLVEGRLRDVGYPATPDGSPKRPQLIHHMVIRWKVRGPEMLIEQATADMPRCPNDECSIILPVIRNLEGLRIAPGFTMKSKKLIGGIRGCAHLTSLVLTMAEATIQGHWAAYLEEKKEGSLGEEDIKNLVNTCHLWREDGPILKKLRKDQKT